MKDHYVYTHTSLKTGSIFYVGKGSGKRAHSPHSRNRHWKNVALSHGFSVKIVARFSNKECAFSFERALIKFIGLKSLVNVCPGGEGGVGSKPGKDHPMYGKTGSLHPRYGAKHSEDDRLAISAGRKNGKKSRMSEDKIEALRVRMHGNKFSIGLKHTDEVKKRISESLSGSCNPAYRSDIYSFSHEGGEKFTGTMHDLCFKYGLNKGNVSWMIKGRNKTVKGWSILRSADVSPE